MTIESGMDDEYWMQEALRLAHKAFDAGEVPVGAVVVREGKLIGSGWNCPLSTHDPSAHAEIVALRDAAARESNYRLTGASLYVTIEPCTMCVGAMIHARIGRIVFGALEPKAGVLESHRYIVNLPQVYNHQFSWQGGVCEEACANIIQTFFKKRREEKKLLKKAGKDSGLGSL